MASSSTLDVDSIITKLLEVRGSRPGKQVNLSEAEIRGLCTTARDVFMNQPVLLELEAPIKICGARPRPSSPLVRAALREFAPDALVLPGPGNTLGSICGQIVLAEGYRGLRSRADFSGEGAGLLISMRR